MVSGHERFPLILSVEECDPKLTDYRQSALSHTGSVPSSCSKRVALRKSEDSSGSVPKLSFSFCTCCKKCIRTRDDSKEKPLGNGKEITKGHLDVNDFQSLRL